MNEIHFENHHKVIFEELSKSKDEILISVAWLSFDLYENLFSLLLTKGVKIKVVVNDDYINNRHEKALDFLEGLGMKLKKIKMYSSRNYMHHKFCIVDKKKLLIGSFNWSKNAQSNYENLLVLEDINLINGALLEFKQIWKLNKSHNETQKKFKCNKCKSAKYNLLLLNRSDYHTEYKIVSVCGCDDYTNKSTGYLDISLYNTIMGLFDNYNYKIEYVKDNDQQVDIIEQEYDYDLTSLFSDLMENTPIHGVALLIYDIVSQDGDGEWMTKVIWKNRFAYDMQMEYYDTFDLI